MDIQITLPSPYWHQPICLNHVGMIRLPGTQYSISYVIISFTEEQKLKLKNQCTYVW